MTYERPRFTCCLLVCCVHMRYRYRYRYRRRVGRRPRSQCLRTRYTHAATGGDAIGLAPTTVSQALGYLQRTTLSPEFLVLRRGTDQFVNHHHPFKISNVHYNKLQYWKHAIQPIRNDSDKGAVALGTHKKYDIRTPSLPRKFFLQVRPEQDPR